MASRRDLAHPTWRLGNGSTAAWSAGMLRTAFGLTRADDDPADHRSSP
jgi:hypothetical protein